MRQHNDHSHQFASIAVGETALARLDKIATGGGADYHQTISSEAA